MPNITHTQTIENRYIAHLAGIEGGKAIIDSALKDKASLAQKHPISNKIASFMIGSMQSGLLMSVGTLLYPLINSSLRSSIFGSTLNVCTTCGLNAKRITDLVETIQSFAEPSQNHSFWQKLVGPYAIGLSASANCAADSEVLNICRSINYANGVVWDTVVDNYKFLVALGIGLTALSTFRQMHSYSKKELQEEENIRQLLISRYGKVATQLKTLEGSPEVQNYAKKIFERQIQINEEIESLKLPNLTYGDIQQITQPVFDAAHAIQLKTKA